MKHKQIILLSLLLVLSSFTFLSAQVAQSVGDSQAPFVVNPNPISGEPSLLTPLEEVFGSTSASFAGGLRGRGNIYQCTTARKLVEHRFYLNLSSAANLWFLVYEGDTFLNGTFNLVHSVNRTNQGPGQGWYSSDPIDFELQPGKFYMIYTQWDVNANYYNQQNITPYPIPCSFGSLYSGVGWNCGPNYGDPPPQVQINCETENEGIAYYQTIVTDDIFPIEPFYDSFDSYTAGQQLACQNPVAWTTWSNVPCHPVEDAYISSVYASSPPNSFKVVAGTDLVKPLGNKTSGTYEIQFSIYVQSGYGGYFNALATFLPPSTYNWAMDCYFYPTGIGAVTGGNTTANFNFSFNTWNTVNLIVNLDTDQAQFKFNGNLIYTWQWTLGIYGGGSPLNLAGINFNSNSASYEMYVDDFLFGDYPVPVELTSFTASANKGAVELNWTTATETNNQGFEIERRNESSEFILFGFVEGKGTTTEPQEYTYLDRNVTSGKYFYRLKQVDFNGRYEYSNEVEVDVTPSTFSLEQNYPNPFNPSTTIRYSIPTSGFVTLKAFDVLGNEVATLVNEQKFAGSYEINFNASQLTSGVYFYTINAGSFVETKKMILMK